MVITIEPGIYFRDFLLEGKLSKDQLNIDLKYLNLDKIREYQTEIQGCRVEDLVYITEDGCELITANVPRTTEEIEACMAGKDW